MSETHQNSIFFFLMNRRPPRSPLFPYPTLFRSDLHAQAHHLLGPPPAPALVSRVQPQARKAREPTPRRLQQEPRSEEHTSELQSRQYLVCRLLLEKKKQYTGY